MASFGRASTRSAPGMAGEWLAAAVAGMTQRRRRSLFLAECAVHIRASAVAPAAPAHHAQAVSAAAGTSAALVVRFARNEVRIGRSDGPPRRAAGPERLPRRPHEGALGGGIVAVEPRLGTRAESREEAV